MNRYLFVVYTLLLLSGGCASELSFPGRGQVSEQTLVSWPLPQIMARALEFAHDRYSPSRDMVINLPPGSPPALYDAVRDRMNSAFPDARPLRAGDPYGFHLTTMRVRDLDAFADVIYPRPDNVYELVTLTLRRSTAYGYQVRSSRLWRFHQVKIPSPTYVPAPPKITPPIIIAPPSSQPEENTPAQEAPAPALPDVEHLDPLSLPPASEPADPPSPDSPASPDFPDQ